MNDLITQLANARGMLIINQCDLALLVQEFEGRSDVSSLRERIEHWRDTIAQLEQQIKEAAIEAYNTVGDKHPHACVTVKVFTGPEYDIAVAKHYALTQQPGLLTLDTKAFNKYALAMATIAPLPFVTLKAEPRAEIKADLKGWATEVEDVQKA